MQAQAFYEGLKSTGEDEIVTLCRSAWAGSQKYGAAVWSGDIASTFEELQAQVRAGMNIGISGIPWWTTDIGGFHGGDPESAYFRELIVRWFQFGTFCPLFRLHGFRLPSDLNRYWISGGPNEVWSFGDEAYEIISDLLHLRERLRPYIMAQMTAAHKKGTPPMRPLFYDFPDDAAAWEIEDQFMFGTDILVAPVLFEGATNRKVYLPTGNSWRNPWSGESFNGGQWIMATAPLHQIPLYLRGDAILPIIS
jgi:alpha-D-xyloside xylohydrolase